MSRTHRLLLLVVGPAVLAPLGWFVANQLLGGPLRPTELQPTPTDDPTPPPDWLEFVPEMKPIPGLPVGNAPDPDAARRQIEKAQASLTDKLPEVEKLVTPDRVRSLSGWARKQMESYIKVPPVTKTTWTAVASDGKSGTILLEGTIDALPTHSALVVRWLKAYLVLDTNRNEITRVIVTIRGERHE